MPMNGPLMIAVVALISVGVFFNGLRFARMTENPLAGKRLLELPVQGGEFSVQRLNLLGKFQMVIAPLFFALFTAIVLGLFGPVN